MVCYRHFGKQMTVISVDCETRTGYNSAVSAFVFNDLFNHFLKDGRAADLIFCSRTIRNKMKFSLTTSICPMQYDIKVLGQFMDSVALLKAGLRTCAAMLSALSPCGNPLPFDFQQPTSWVHSLSFTILPGQPKQLLT